jgi:malonyl-CoA O-methyltransferase
MDNEIKNNLNKKKIAKNFSKAAPTYDKWALPQNIIAKNTISLLDDNLIPENIIDLGCGTGKLINSLQKKFQNSCITGIDIADGMIKHCTQKYDKYKNINFYKKDIEEFSTSCCSYNLAISSFSLQWILNPISTFLKIHSLLKKNGLFVFSLPINGTLKELSDSYEKSLQKKMYSLKYNDELFYINALQHSNFKILKFKIAYTQSYFKDIDIFRYFKKTGTTLNAMHHESPLKITELNKLVHFYKKKYSNKDGSIPVSYRVLYIVAKKDPKDESKERY